MKGDGFMRDWCFEIENNIQNNIKIIMFAQLLEFNHKKSDHTIIIIHNQWYKAHTKINVFIDNYLQQANTYFHILNHDKNRGNAGMMIRWWLVADT